MDALCASRRWPRFNGEAPLFQPLGITDKTPTDRSDLDRAQRISAALARLLVAISAVTLVVGWGFGVDAVVRIVPGWPSMVPGTAALFGISALSVLIFLRTGHAWGTAMLGLAIIGLCLSDFMGRLFHNLVPAGDGMALATRVEFLLTGLSIALLPTRQRYGAAVLSATAISGLLVTNLFLVGHFFFDTTYVFQIDVFSRLSLNSAICFVISDLMILYATTRRNVMHLLLDLRPGSQMLKAMLPIVLMGPPILGISGILAMQPGGLSVRNTVGVMTILSGWLILGALFVSARWINWMSDQERAAITRLHDREMELASAEALAARVQKSSSLGRVAGGVAHDFNNLLSVIQGNLELLRESKDPEERGKCIEDALAATRRGADLTQKLLSYGQKSVLDPEVLILDRKLELLDGMLRRFVPARIELLIRPASDRGRILADRSQLEQAVLSLVSNAVEAIDQFGRIEVSTGWLRLSPVAQTLVPHPKLPPGNYLYVAVEDDGCGIPEDQLGRITEPFYSTKSLGQSSGLGLSMVQGFCQQSGGYLDVESQVGIGSRFVMYFPEFAEAEPMPVPSAARRTETAKPVQDHRKSA